VEEEKQSEKAEKPKRSHHKKKPVVAEQVVEAGIALDFEEGSYTGEDKKSVLDKAKEALGIKSSGTQSNESGPKVYRKLTKAQKDFCDDATPIAVGLFVLVSGWIWGLAGEEYEFLAPTETVANAIIAPLIRVYIRNAKEGTSINPNALDILASATALVGYIKTSSQLYAAIKRGELVDASATGFNAQTEDIGDAGNYRSPYLGTPQTESDHAYSASVGNARQPTYDNLTERERRQREALARLSSLDFEHRRRRSAYV
jgi:hypothetical protein